MHEERLRARREVLEALGAPPEVIAEALAYCESPFGLHRLGAAPALPLEDEPHLAAWREYAAAPPGEAFAALQARLPQLAIPIRAGISASDAYRGTVLRGAPFDEATFGGRLALAAPDAFRLLIHEHPAGALPVLITSHRGDFDTLLRAVVHRSEPTPVAPAVHAQMVSGFINWDRVARYEARWRAELGDGATDALWRFERGRVARDEKGRFYDSFMLLCCAPYSKFTAAELGLGMDEALWLDRSTTFRLEHEFTHYATKRLYGRMSLNLLDETICDWAGMTEALGFFEADYFLRFLGLHALPDVLPEGRVHTYCEGLSPAAFSLICRLTAAAARGLEALSRDLYRPRERTRFTLALTDMTLELLAAEERERLFAESLERAARLAP